MEFKCALLPPPRAGNSLAANNPPSVSSPGTGTTPAPPDTPPPSSPAAPRRLSSQRPARFLNSLQDLPGNNGLTLKQRTAKNVLPVVRPVAKYVAGIGGFAAVAAGPAYGMYYWVKSTVDTRVVLVSSDSRYVLFQAQGISCQKAIANVIASFTAEHPYTDTVADNLFCSIKTHVDFKMTSGLIGLTGVSLIASAFGGAKAFQIACRNLESSAENAPGTENLHRGDLYGADAQSPRMAKVVNFLNQVAWSLPEENRAATMEKLTVVLQSSLLAQDDLVKFTNSDNVTVPRVIRDVLEPALMRTYAHLPVSRREVADILQACCMEAPARAAAGSSQSPPPDMAPRLNAGKLLLALAQTHQIEEGSPDITSRLRAMRDRGPIPPPQGHSAQAVAQSILENVAAIVEFVDETHPNPAPMMVGYANTLFPAVRPERRGPMLDALSAYLADAENMETFAHLASSSDTQTSIAAANALAKIPDVKAAVLEILPSLPVAPGNSRHIAGRAMVILDERMEQHRDFTNCTSPEDRDRLKMSAQAIAAEVARLALPRSEVEKILRSQCGGREPILFGDQEYDSACRELMQRNNRGTPISESASQSQVEIDLAESKRVANFLLNLRSESAETLVAIAQAQAQDHNPAEDLVDMLILQARAQIELRAQLRGYTDEMV
jgi:hypothetical protein